MQLQQIFQLIRRPMPSVRPSTQMSHRRTIRCRACIYTKDQNKQVDFFVDWSLKPSSNIRRSPGCIEDITSWIHHLKFKLLGISVRVEDRMKNRIGWSDRPPNLISESSLCIWIWVWRISNGDGSQETHVLIFFNSSLDHHMHLMSYVTQDEQFSFSY